MTAAVCLQGTWGFIERITRTTSIINIWPIWPALRAMVLPRFRLACNGLTAMLEIRSLSVEEGRHALASAVGAVWVAFNVTTSVQKCGGSVETQEPALDPLAEELGQVLVVHPQFLSMVKASAAS